MNIAKLWRASRVSRALPISMKPPGLLTLGVAAVILSASPGIAPQAADAPQLRRQPVQKAPEVSRQRIPQKTEPRKTAPRLLTPLEPAPPQAGSEPPEPPSRPDQHALLVLLENGGVVSNMESAGINLEHEVPMASCGNWRFALQPGETPAQLLPRVTHLISDNAHCLNPFNWRVHQMTLSDWVDNTSDWLIEESVKGTSAAYDLAQHYDEVVFLEDYDFKTDKVLETIAELAPDYVLDIHIMAHGGEEFIVAHGDDYLAAGNFFDPLKDMRDAGEPLFIRAVYQMNCRGGTLKDDWLDLGVEVVNGTEGARDNSMPHQYAHFMSHWLGGMPFGQATQMAYSEASQYTAPLYNLFPPAGPEALSDSVLTAEGNGGLTVGSP